LNYLNLLDTKLDQLALAGRPEVEVKGAIPLGPKEPLPRIELCLHQFYHLSPNLVATGANAWAEASYDVGGAAAAGFHHSGERLRSNPFDGAFPASVGQADHLVDGVIE